MDFVSLMETATANSDKSVRKLAKLPEEERKIKELKNSRYALSKEQELERNMLGRKFVKKNTTTSTNAGDTIIFAGDTSSDSIASSSTYSSAMSTKRSQPQKSSSNSNSEIQSSTNPGAGKGKPSGGPPPTAVQLFLEKKKKAEKQKLEERIKDKEKLMKARVEANKGKVSKRIAKQFSLKVSDVEEKIPAPERKPDIDSPNRSKFKNPAGEKPYVEFMDKVKRTKNNSLEKSVRKSEFSKSSSSNSSKSSSKHSSYSRSLSTKKASVDTPKSFHELMMIASANKGQEATPGQLPSITTKKAGHSKLQSPSRPSNPEPTTEGLFYNAAGSSNTRRRMFRDAEDITVLSGPDNHESRYSDSTTKQEQRDNSRSGNYSKPKSSTSSRGFEHFNDTARRTSNPSLPQSSKSSVGQAESKVSSNVRAGPSKVNGTLKASSMEEYLRRNNGKLKRPMVSNESLATSSRITPSKVPTKDNNANDMISPDMRAEFEEFKRQKMAELRREMKDFQKQKMREFADRKRSAYNPSRPAYNPSPPRYGVSDDEEDSEYDSDMADFIDDSDQVADMGYNSKAELDAAMKEVFNYDKRKYMNEKWSSKDDQAMVASYRQMEAEERRSGKIGKMEDLRELLREQGRLPKRK